MYKEMRTSKFVPFTQNYVVMMMCAVHTELRCEVNLALQFTQICDDSFR